VRFAAVPGYAETGTERWVTWGRPTGGAHGPIGDLGRFRAALLDRRLLAPPVIEAMTTRHVSGAYDELLQATVDRGLGFMLGSTYRGHGFGPHASGRTFGHGGRNWCQALADPAHDLPRPSTGTAASTATPWPSASTVSSRRCTKTSGWCAQTEQPHDTGDNLLAAATIAVPLGSGRTVTSRRRGGPRTCAPRRDRASRRGCLSRLPAPRGRS
jgi:hypothetical protein